MLESMTPCTASPTRDKALHLAIDRSILQLHLQGMSGGPAGLSILQRFRRGETDLLAMSFELEAYLEAD